MRLSPLPSAALLALLLSACGGNLEGGTAPVVPGGDPTPTPAPVIPPPAESGVSFAFEYIGASPSWVAVKGTGGVGRQESSIVSFKLLDRNAEPVTNTEVSFSLKGPNGTLIEPLTGTTNDSGIVSTTLSSGKVSGPVRITVATISGEISTISDSLSVSTGLPDQNSFSISAETWSPEGLKIEGVESAVTLRLADKYNNAVPDGTTVYFTTEGGAIRDKETGTVGSCLTVASQCSLTWVSQNPRPIGNRLSVEGLPKSGGCAAWAFTQGINFGPCINNYNNGNVNDDGMGQPYGGRATITAYTLGEEAFTDNDADGWFTPGDDFFVKNDLPEVFYDNNEDGYYKEDTNAFNTGDEEEEYADLSPTDNVYSKGNGIYNGPLCSLESEKAGTCSREPVYVRTSAVMIMADSVPYIRIQDNGVDTGSVDLTGSNKERNLTAYLAGIHNNAPPSGTTVTLSTDNGIFSGPITWVVGSGLTGPFIFRFTMTQEDEPNKKTSGKAVITIVTPGGNSIAGTTTTYTMTVTDDAAPVATPTPAPVP